MFPNGEFAEAVGRYAGPTGTVLMVMAVIIIVLSRMPGTPQDKNKRFSKLLVVTVFFGLLAFGSLLFVRIRTSAFGSVTTVNTTSGDASPILPGNSGKVTITNNQSSADGGNHK
jgi:hypothetical protein